MQIDRMIFPIESLGPGRRFAIWTVGCSKRCYNCANPELWDGDESKDVDADSLYDLIRGASEGREVDGFTFTGGDPLEQPGELIRLLEPLREISDDILVYTGFTLEELPGRLRPDELSDLRRLIGVLVDGRYVEAQNDGATPLCGSSNQTITFFNEGLRERYELYMGAGRRIRNVFYGDSVMSVGFHSKDV